MIKILNMFLIGKWYRRIELIALILNSYQFLKN